MTDAIRDGNHVPVSLGVSNTNDAVTLPLKINSSTGKLQVETSSFSGNSLTIIGQTSPTYAQGKLVYDTDNEALTFYNNDSMVALQLGQEEWIRVKNVSGSTLPNGAAVYMSGASGGLPTVALAQANSGSTTVGVGLVTESIANNAIGYVTCIGIVHGLDTSAFSAGAIVFISATVAGGLTATAPTAPNFRYRVGIVAVSSATVGTIHVTPSTASLGNGSANQVFGINNGGTAQEVKTLAVGTTGTNFAVSNTTNTITFNLPDASASARGVVTTGAQTLAGAKTLNALLTTTGINTALSTITAVTYTATSTDHTLLCDATSNAITITLPASSGATGRIYNIKKIDASVNAVTVDGNASETIDGATTQVLSTQWQNLQIQCNGTNWFIT